MLLRRVIDRIRREMLGRAFEAAAAGVLDTAPVRSTNADAIVVSMVCHAHVRMYLCAIKSFMRWGLAARPLVLDDGSLTEQDRQLLRHHLPDVAFRNINTISMGRCQAGGTWERLRLIAELCANSYVIQLDADTLSTAPLTEVRDAVARNRSFLLSGDEATAVVETFSAASRRADGLSSSHMQVALERRLFRVPDAESRRYARGCSAFAGFARAATTTDALDALHDEMGDLLGARWTEWGSEQVTSNLVLAAQEDTVVLPVPRYASYFPDTVGPQHYAASAFLHFVGSHRFEHGTYRDRVRATLAQLSG